MIYAIWCGSVPTDLQCRAIHGAISRFMAKKYKPFYSHSLVVSGPCAEGAFAALSHAGCNVTLKEPKRPATLAIVVSGPAPREFTQIRKQVLTCRDD
ncbi:hypothetical protein pEaSNUABM17_00120 [Erwinia phage pEa_SNUABM_17]|uniref:Uncharacterized protein n=1 Tax=Erwinia phage pEa_SNUABM_17 TaxID=2869545 RepID=A0AAE7XJV7_9CAUD|nr:hypothetical protein MPK72_gp120 [Erwinia phage pEa_SNUABM_17]QZE57666.1 hypothetical protein pEaSNUABM17_00120 [Erwinia phage pEa_SNUABM_17]